VSDLAVQVVAQAVAAGCAALYSRREAVESQMIKERTRWAYEIHDGLTQAVTTAVLELEALAHRIQRDPQEAIDALTATKTEIRKSLSELRGILFELQREQEREERADEPLTKYVQDVVRRWRLPARITIKGDLHHVPKPLLGAAYVVIREALANAAKHASARSVTVWVGATTEELVVEVEDTGRGFRASQKPGAAEPRHFGLEMMKKRVAEVGGTLDVQSQPGRGTQVVARLPIRSKASS
jgi:two-component system sensor histidine kinase DegS